MRSLLDEVARECGSSLDLDAPVHLRLLPNASQHVISAALWRLSRDSADLGSDRSWRDIAAVTMDDLYDLRNVGAKRVERLVYDLARLAEAGSRPLEPLPESSGLEEDETPATRRALRLLLRQRQVRELAANFSDLVVDRFCYMAYGGNSRSFTSIAEGSEPRIGDLVARFEEEERAGAPNETLLRVVMEMARLVPSNGLFNMRVAIQRAWDGASMRGYALECGIDVLRLERLFVGAERAVRIAQLRMQSGATLSEIAELERVSRERVRQILSKWESVLPEECQGRLNEPAEGIAAAAKRETDLAMVVKIVRRIVQEPGVRVSELADACGVGTSYVLSRIPKPLKKFVQMEARQEPRKMWTDDELIAQLKQAATYAFPLAAFDFDNLVTRGVVRGASAMTIMNRFGSWTAACGRAEVEAYKPVRATYTRRWSTDEIVGFVLEYLLDFDTRGTAADYDAWRQQQTLDAPSFALVRLEMGSWSSAKEAALSALAQRGGLDASPRYCAYLLELGV